MNILLSPLEARVIGSLIEKERTTPDQYPLSLNALVNACNQKSSRDPVMALQEPSVQEVIDELIKKRLVSEQSGFGSRVTKYRHRLYNTEFGDLQFTEQESAIICLLLLRGPQTSGELRIRSERLCKFTSIEETESVLERLMAREDGPFVARLPREAGKRESRYTHLFCGPVEDIVESRDTEVTNMVLPDVRDERLEAMEKALQAMRAEIDDLKNRLVRIAPDDRQS